MPGFRRVLLIAPPGPSGAYLSDAVLDAMLAGDAPFISQITALTAVDAGNPQHQRYALAAVSEWVRDAAAAVVYIDFGTHDPQTRALLQVAENLGLPVEGRSMEHWKAISPSTRADDVAAWTT